MRDAITPYCGPAPLPGDLAAAWNTDPVLLGLMVLALGAVARARHRGAFLLGWGALALAFVSPLCALTVALFSARTVHHLVLMGIAAPALALALPLRRLPAGVAAAALGAALTAWHLPAVYAAAWDSPATYWAMQAALGLPAWAFWSALLHRRPAGATGLFAAAALIAGLAALMGLIGAILTFAPHPLYPEHLASAPAFGLTPLMDQQLAGLIMWVPGFVPLAALAALLARRGWRRAAEAPA